MKRLIINNYREQEAQMKEPSREYILLREARNLVTSLGRHHIWAYPDRGMRVYEKAIKRLHRRKVEHDRLHPDKWLDNYREQASVT